MGMTERPEQRSIPAHAGGARCPQAWQSCDVGSIPAHAGEPVLRLKSSTFAEVYPRPRGGAR